MEAVQIKISFAKVKFHARVLWRGFCRVIYGSVVTGLIAMAIYLFVSITEKTGWTAVWRFVVACVLLAEGIGNMYFVGRKKTGSGNRKKAKVK